MHYHHIFFSKQLDIFTLKMFYSFCCFVSSLFNQVFTAIVNIIEKPWERVSIDGKPHLHGWF